MANNIYFGVNKMFLGQSKFDHPFGEESCEHEIQVLGDSYFDYFFDDSRFNKEIVNSDIYLIVGRRGTGKTSLTKHLEKYGVYKNIEFIYIDGSAIYDEAFGKIISDMNFQGDMLTNRAIKVWEYIFWLAIFDRLSEYDRLIKDASIFSERHANILSITTDILKHLISTIIKDEKMTIVDALEKKFAEKNFISAQKKVLEIAEKRQIMIAVDTIDRYDKDNPVLMSITAGLIQCASNFHIQYSRKGIHIKAFIADEVFPLIQENAITNPSKYIRNPMQVKWKPKDLLKLLCLRIKLYAQNERLNLDLPSELEDFDEIIHKIWNPFFGKTLINESGVTEKSFLLIIGLTQLRPRQCITLCNEIFKASGKENGLPVIEPETVREVIARTTNNFANDVINSYAKIYPNIGEILSALRSFPIEFDAKLLDRVAKRTAYAWSPGSYSMAEFRKLLSQLGIIGRVRDKRGKIISAEFEYLSDDRLFINDNDLCVIHPMFYRWLNVDIHHSYIVYPF